MRVSLAEVDGHYKGWILGSDKFRNISPAESCDAVKKSNFVDLIRSINTPKY
jgi:hypothetical protein